MYRYNNYRDSYNDCYPDYHDAFERYDDYHDAFDCYNDYPQDDDYLYNGYDEDYVNYPDPRYDDYDGSFLRDFRNLGLGGGRQDYNYAGSGRQPHQNQSSRRPTEQNYNSQVLPNRASVSSFQQANSSVYGYGSGSQLNQQGQVLTNRATSNFSQGVGAGSNNHNYRTRSESCQPNGAASSSFQGNANCPINNRGGPQQQQTTRTTSNQGNINNSAQVNQQVTQGNRQAPPNQQTNMAQRSQTQCPNNGQNRNTNNQNNRVPRESENQRETLIQQLTRGRLDCLICFEQVRSKDSTWSCSKCYHVLHLSCTQRWSRTIGDDDHNASRSGSWRCPVCQFSYTAYPAVYKCFCGKVVNPVQVSGVTPHGCGYACQKPKASCSHVCSSACHPGPCPPCSVPAVVHCLCGKMTRTYTCTIPNQFSCNKRCNRKLDCKRHWCKSKCHSGPCNNCTIVRKLSCYCKEIEWQVPCGQWINLSCGEVCESTLDCGNHYCRRVCHRGRCRPCNECEYFDEESEESSEYDDEEDDYESAEGNDYYY